MEISRECGVDSRNQQRDDATYHQIDRLVYALYRLADEEIGIVEG